MDRELVVLLTVLIGVPMWVALAASGLLGKAEHAVTWAFSSWTQRPRWFSMWVVIAPVWALSRWYLVHVVHAPWYTDDIDFDVTTFLWSIVPYWVENSLKASQGQVLDAMMRILGEIADLVSAIRSEQDRARERDEQIQHLLEEAAARDDATQAVLDRVLDAIEDKEGGVSTNGHA